MSEPIVKGFGLRKSHDSRDAQYLMRSVLRPTKYRKFRYYSPGPLLPLDQGETGTCVAHAWGGFLAAAPIVTEEFPHPYDMYRGIIKDDEFPENDHEVTATDLELQFGTTIRAGAKYLRAQGHLKTFVWARNADEMAAWILTGQGTIVVGTNWYFGMSDLDEDDLARPTGECLGGHAYLVIGYTRVGKKFRCINSWGAEYGDRGRFWMRHDDMERLIRHEDGEACAATEQVLVPRQ